MTPFIKVSLAIAFLSVTLSQAHPDGFHFGWGGRGGTGGMSFGLSPQFYQFSCPQANDIVMSVLEKAISKDMRMAASLLRLHFHDCFVQVKGLVKTITVMIINKVKFIATKKKIFIS